MLQKSYWGRVGNLNNAEIATMLLVIMLLQDHRNLHDSICPGDPNAQALLYFFLGVSAYVPTLSHLVCSDRSKESYQPWAVGADMSMQREVK